MPFAFYTWATIIRQKIQLAVDVKRLSSNELNSKFNEVQEKFIKPKAMKERLDPKDGNSPYRMAFAHLQLEFWSALAYRRAETEGPSCAKDVAEMTKKCLAKHSIVTNLSRPAKMSSAVEGVEENDFQVAGGRADRLVRTAIFFSDMANFLRSSASEAHRSLLDKISVTAMGCLVQAMEAADDFASSIDFDVNTSTPHTQPSSIPSRQQHNTLDVNESDSVQASAAAARQLFPIVIQQLRYSPLAAKFFVQSCALRLGVWKCLPWINQLLSALPTPAGEAVAPLISRVAEHHPQVVFYPYMCLAEDLDILYQQRRQSAQPLSGEKRREREEIGSMQMPQCEDAVCEVIAKLDMISRHAEMYRVRQFSRSLHKLHFPELRVIVWLDDIKIAIRAAIQAPRGSSTHRSALHRAQQLWEKCFYDCLDATQPNLGVYNKKFAQDYGPLLQRKLCRAHRAGSAGTLRLLTISEGGGISHGGIENNSDPDQIKTELQVTMKNIGEITLQLRGALKNVKATAQIATLSPELVSLGVHESHGAVAPQLVELPVQPFHFLNFPTAVPRAIVVGIDPMMRVMMSKEKPKKITVYTSDERSRSFLVKGGDDLRLDQRIQAVFDAVNKALLNVPSTESQLHRRLCIRTYSVVPISKKTGIVEWVPNTETMKEVIERRMALAADPAGSADTSKSSTSSSASAKVETHPGIVQYWDFMRKIDPSNQYAAFVQSFRAVTNKKGEHSKRVQEWIAKGSPNYLRDGIAAYGNSRSDWFHLREAYTHSFASVSAMGYMLGVGDRHLQNFLIDKQTGQLIAIDFGMAFGSATMQLQIPELMPLRATPQMMYALGPLGAASGLSPGMAAVLRKIQQNKSLLVALMSVFLDEPLMNWVPKDPTIPRTEQQLSEDTISSQKRLNIVSRKIAMVNPVLLLMEEVKENRFVREAGVMDAVLDVIRGEPVKRELSADSSGQFRLESAEQQVKYLLDLATDDNILGRTWVGWMPLL